MAKHRATGRRLRSVRNYNVAELAEKLSVCRNTVRNWMRQGLEPIDGQKPFLFAGDVVKAFLARRAAARKHKCGPDQLYCLACRKPRRPALCMVDLTVGNGGTATITAFCEVCETVMNRFVRVADAAELATNLSVNERPQSDALIRPGFPALNCDL